MRMYVCVYVTLFIAKIIVIGQGKLCEAQPRDEKLRHYGD